MIERAVMSPAVPLVVALSCLFAAGCCGVRHAETPESVATIPVPEETAAPAPQEVPAPVAVVAPEAQQAPVPTAPDTVPPVSPVMPPKRSPGPPPAAVATKTAPVPAPVPAPVSAMVPKAAPKVATAPPPPRPAAAPLDLKMLGERLRETKAIGVMTKLSLKNQVDDLLEKFRGYHRRQSTATLVELRRHYDMLVLKVLSLLQDSDPTLARDIVRSRTAIWDILADPRKFNDPNLVAGVAP